MQKAASLDELINVKKIFDFSSLDSFQLSFKNFQEIFY